MAALWTTAVRCHPFQALASTRALGTGTGPGATVAASSTAPVPFGPARDRELDKQVAYFRSRTPRCGSVTFVAAAALTMKSANREEL